MSHSLGQKGRHRIANGCCRKGLPPNDTVSLQLEASLKESNGSPWPLENGRVEERDAYGLRKRRARTRLSTKRPIVLVVEPHRVFTLQDLDVELIYIAIHVQIEVARAIPVKISKDNGSQRYAHVGSPTRVVRVVYIPALGLDYPLHGPQKALIVHECSLG